MRLAEHINALKILGIYGQGIATLTVGAKAQYPTIQAAVNAALLNAQFTATKDTATPTGGVVTCTKGSRTVTGDANTYFAQGGLNVTADPFLNGDRYFSVSTGAVKKWYKVAMVVADNQILLDSPFQENTVVTAAGNFWSGKPNITNIVVLDAFDVTSGGFNVSSDGTNSAAKQITEVALRFIWPNRVNHSGAIRIWAASGVIEFYGLHHNSTSRTVITPHYTGAADVNPVVDYRFFNVDRDTCRAVDWVFHGVSGSMEFTSIDTTGEYDSFLPDVLGSVNFTNVRSFSKPKTVAVTSTTINRAMAQPWALGVVGGRLHARDSTFAVCTTGINAIGTRLFDFVATQGSGATPSQCIAVFDDCTFLLDGSLGGAQAADTVGIALGISDSDIYFNHCSFTQLGAISSTGCFGIGRHSTSQGAVTANRLHFNETIPWDLPNDNTAFVVSEFKGAKGRPKLLTQAIVAAEFDYLRGDAFYITAVSAARAIPAMVNAPEGAEVSFTFTQDGTGGYAITWDASFVFLTAWSNAGNTANKSSSATFRKTGARWIQVSAANSWV